MNDPGAAQELGNLACFACGAESEEECRCRRTNDEIAREMRSLVTAAYHAVARRELHRARMLLGRASRLDVQPVDTLKVYGLCSFAVGDIRTAAGAWRAAANAGDPRASVWFESLQSGEVRAALLTYQEAVAQAKQEHWSSAHASVESVLCVLPTFLPAVRLQGLALWKLGAVRAACDTWRRGLEFCRDDARLLRLLASVQQGHERNHSDTIRARKRSPAWLVAASVVLILVVGAVTVQEWPNVRPPVSAAENSIEDEPTVTPFSQNTILVEQFAAGLDAALAGDVERVNELLRALGIGPAELSERAREELARRERSLGWNAFRRGRDYAAAGEWGAAVSHLDRAVNYAGGTFYEDDAMYLLARAYDQTGASHRAREMARRILMDHPESMFANSIIRRLAGAEAVAYL